MDRPGLLTQAEFHRLVDVPPEAQWFANLAETPVHVLLSRCGVQMGLA
jgi:hypothetical protein